MTREQIYKLLDQEHRYAFLQWDKTPDHIPDHLKSIEQWLYWIKEYLGQASSANNADRCLDRLRCVANLCVECFTYHGCPPRVSIEDAFKFFADYGNVSKDADKLRTTPVSPSQLVAACQHAVSVGQDPDLAQRYCNMILQYQHSQCWEQGDTAHDL